MRWLLFVVFVVCLFVCLFVCLLFTIDLIHEPVIVRLRHSLPDGKLQKEERVLFYSWIAVNDGKGRRVQ